MIHLKLFLINLIVLFWLYILEPVPSFTGYCKAYPFLVALFCFSATVQLVFSIWLYIP